MKRVVLSILVVFSFLVSPFSPSAASLKFKDIEGMSWAKNEILFLANQGIIKGYGNGKFGPNDPITASQGLLMVERVVKKKVSFSSGSKPLTRGEVALLLDRAFDFNRGDIFPFYDVHPKSSYYESINLLTSNHIALGYSDGSFRPDERVTRAQFSVFLARILEPSYRKVIAMEQQVKQRIIVTSTSKTTATVQLQKLNGTNWQNVNSSYQAVIGKNGMGKTKEGDGKTPTGTYPLGTAFGWGTPIQNLQYPFKKATNQDYWVDDVKSKDYNQWVTYSGNPSVKWNSFERMTHSLYKYGVVIRYNDNPIVAGKGSAIFLHTRTSSTKHTLGCIALNEKELVTLIKGLDKKWNPVIVIQ